MLNVLYNKDGELVLLRDVQKIIPAENGTKFLIQSNIIISKSINQLIPANKVLFIESPRVRMRIFYNKDGEVVKLSNRKSICPAENGTKFLIQSQYITQSHVLIPANKLLAIQFRAWKKCTQNG